MQRPSVGNHIPKYYGLSAWSQKAGDKRSQNEHDQARRAEGSQAQSAKMEWLFQVPKPRFAVLFSHKLEFPLSQKQGERNRLPR